MQDDGRSQRWWWPRPVRIPKGMKQGADHRAGESLIPLLDQAGRAEVETLLARGEFVPAVRRVRELTGLRLIDAKRVAESLQR
jgi:ribosomal protein L7/L12